MNPQQVGSSHRLQWWRIPWILGAYIAFAVLASAWGHFGITHFPRFYEKTVRFTGGSGLSFYPFTLIVVVSAILTPRRNSGRYAVVGLLIVGAIFGLWDTYEHTWGSWVGRDNHGNPYLIYSLWRPLITVAVPLFWAFMLLSPPMNRWVMSGIRCRTPHDVLFMRLMAWVMPSRMVIVEGKHDELFLKTLFRIRFPKQKISVNSVAPSTSYSEIEEKLFDERDYWGELQNMPFHNRMFFVFDLQNSERRNRFVELGIRVDQTEILSKQGIERYYPRSIMKSVFQCGDAELDDMNADSSEIEINGLRKTKDELAKSVCAQLTGETVLDDELTNLLAKISETT